MIEKPEVINEGDLLTKEDKRNIEQMLNAQDNKLQIHIHFNETSSDEMIKEPEDITEPDHLTKLKEEINRIKQMVTDKPEKLKLIIHFNKTSSDEMIKEPEDITEPDHLTK